VVTILLWQRKTQWVPWRPLSTAGGDWRVYRSARKGDLQTQDASRCAKILQIMVGMIRDSWVLGVTAMSRKPWGLPCLLPDGLNGPEQMSRASYRQAASKARTSGKSMSVLATSFR